MGTRSSKEEEVKEEAKEEPKSEERAVMRPKLVGGHTELLDLGDLVFLYTRLPVHPRPSVWSCLYMSKRDGKSFTKLVHSIRKMERTLILVRDDGGHVFGMYAGDAWKDPADREEEFRRDAARKKRENRMGRSYEISKSDADTNFYGTGDCALLAVKPEQKIFRPTKMNTNYMYLQTSWPEPELNGIAMGGLPNLFGVHLDSTLTNGSFKGAGGKCMTFNSPCLAHKPDFLIEEVEVWALGNEELAGRVDSSSGIMDKAETKADKKIMELAGKKFYTDDLHRDD
eukprot:TRINITY_DN47681_c0_g1_i1.p1 TRINITY_DN47681_c0_g1~~TRINITY_DN47681_c0_g1_i1.p1  ORF type:complete len:284 (+),score=89.16 TRINITY_DN47681_c0_g1_i1:272-1123(+)